MHLVEVYCLSSEFVKFFEEKIIQKNKIGRKSHLSREEFITIGILKQQLGIQTNKQLYYLVKEKYNKDFPNIPSYQQFSQGLKDNFIYLMLIDNLICVMNRQKKQNLFIIDSMPLPICSNGHRYKLKTGKGLAGAGKNLNGWYYGFKLNLIINLNMEIVSMKITSGNTKDIAALDKSMIKGLKGLLVGDKGYISKRKTEELLKLGIRLITRSRKNMKQLPSEKLHILALKNRIKIESVFSKLKYRFNLVNKYARSLEGYFSQLFSAILNFHMGKINDFSLFLDDFERIVIS